MRSDVIMEESTFDKYIKNDIKQKKKFDKEYNNFLLSEFIRGTSRSFEPLPTMRTRLSTIDTSDSFSPTSSETRSPVA